MVSLFSTILFSVYLVQFNNSASLLCLIFFTFSLMRTKKIETYSFSHPITSQFILIFWYDFWASCMFSFISLRIPGRLNDRRTPLGELNWIFTAITDTIAWNVLPRGLFWQKSSYSTIWSFSFVSINSTDISGLPQGWQIHFGHWTSVKWLWLSQNPDLPAFLVPQNNRNCLRCCLCA